MFRCETPQRRNTFSKENTEKRNAKVFNSMRDAIQNLKYTKTKDKDKT